jgi:glycosyltransferase involved in cell wall biosynthesis
MKMRDLSILIPSRNEMFLNNTIQDILNNIEADTEVIAVLDGQWPIEPIPDNPRVILIHFSESIGQRAATNVAARISKAKYLMKLDAHCAMDKGFDVKLMNDMQDNWTQVPIMRNLHAFDWVCECGHIRYQGPTKPCEKCGKDMKRELRWIAKTNPQSTAFRYDTTLHFQYWQDWKKKQVGDLVETFSLQGSCFMCTREKYFELNLCDETWGSWGNQGTEVATKTWLSGGRVVVNKKTFYAHLFRTQGNDFGFPYPQSGRAVERARNFSRELFFNNGYDKQIYPLSWLIGKFKPIPDWHEESGKEVLDRVLKAGTAFTNFQNKSHGVLGVIPSVPGSVTNHATSMSSDGRGKEVPVPTVGLPTLPGSGTITAKDVLLIREEAEMGGITTISDTTNMVKDRDSLSLTCGDGSNKPSVNKSVDSVENLADSNLSVSPVKATIPKPATSFDINPDLPENSVNSYNRHILDNKHIMDVHDTSIAQKQKSKGILFYTNNRLNMKLAALVRKQIAKSGLPVTCVSQKPVGFGTNLVFKGDGKSGQVNMYRQILMGLEHMKEDIVFLAEADVLYHPFHFQFTPAESNKFYYNGNYWVLRLKDGFAVHYNAQWLSGLVSYREPLLVHMRERVEMIDREGYSTNMGHEPMTHKRIAWKTWYDYEVFNPGVANIDIVHSGNMTLKKWKLDDFRTKPKFWEESTNYTVPGWNLVEELKRIDKSA